MFEIRDAELATALLLESLPLARLAARDSAAWRQALRVANELAGSGAPLVPLGFIADIAHLAAPPAEAEAYRAPASPVWTAWLARYEDHVLGKLYADASFERAAAAIARYQGREQDQALAFAVDQMRQRAQIDGVAINPAVARALASSSSDLDRRLDQVDHEAVREHLVPLCEALVDGIRNVGEVLGVEDLFELEHRTAIAPPGERLALRQVLAAREMLLADIPRQPPRHAAPRREVPTRLLDENAYPVGGFASIATRGTIESLLHSQLAFMEPAGAERPDLFDIKFLRDELLYYSRDENQFFRRRRTFTIVLDPDLRAARVKDAALPYQRIVLALALVVAAVDRLLAWLGDESLTFEILLIDDSAKSLAAEVQLLRLLLREEVAHGTASVEVVARSAVAPRVLEASRHSLCQCLVFATAPRTLDALPVAPTQVIIDGPAPTSLDEAAAWRSESSGLTAWQDALGRMLERLR